MPHQYKFITPVFLITGRGAGVTEKKILVDVGSVREDSYFKAKGSGMSADALLRVRTVEYSGQQRIRYGTKIMSVYRAFQCGEGITELHLMEKKGEQI